MFWKPLLLSLLVGTAAGSLIVPGTFVVEYEDLGKRSSLLDIPGASKVMDFDSKVFKGASIKFEEIKDVEQHIAELKAMPGIKNAWPKRLHPAPDASVSWVASKGSSATSVFKRADGNDTDTAASHILTQVDMLRAKGITGEGVKIAIIDTGLDYTHPALGGCFGPNCLVVGGYDFVGDNFNGTNTPVPDDDPMDCEGHGTHVAGIIAAQPNELGFTGAAPGVKLASYRVFGCQGPAGTDVLVAAFLRAQQEGANIVSASLGEATGWGEDVLSVVASRLVAEGVIFVAAAGNSGSDGMFMASGPASGEGVAAIGSVDNSVVPEFLVRGNYSVSGGPTQHFEYMSGYPNQWDNVSLPLWTPSSNLNQSDQGCNPFPDNTTDLSDKIVLLRRGGCLFSDKAKNAAARGAQYILISNNEPNTLFIDVSDSGANITAIGMVPSETGMSWARDLAAGKNITLQFDNILTSKFRVVYSPNNVTGGYMSFYSSWGPSFESYFGSNFATPGQDILSTYPVAKGSYAVMSGTSMSTPLAAAIYALLSNVRKTFNPAELRNVLAATSKPMQANVDGDVSPLLAPVAHQGAGIVQVYDAAYATTVLSTPNLAFNETARLTDKNFTISNTGHEDITYELDVIGAATAYTFSNNSLPDPFPGLQFDASFAAVDLSEYKVTVPAGGKSEIVVKVKPPSVDTARLPVYGGYIRLNGTNGEKLSLPYQGITGDLNSHTVLNMTYVARSYDVPDLPAATPEQMNFVFPRQEIANISLAYALPLCIWDLYLGSPLVKVEILSTSNGTTSNGSTSLGYANESFIRWNGRKTSGYAWNGQLADKSWVPAGSYKFRVSALHVHGNEEDKDQYDVAEGPSFTIRYTESEGKPEPKESEAKSDPKEGEKQQEPKDSEEQSGLKLGLNLGLNLGL